MADGQITVLAENTAGTRGTLAEHGLAFWIELAGKRLLFDTGQGCVLAGNARRLGIALSTVDAIALSHGHYDHTGGLEAVMRPSRKTPVFAHPDALQEKYARNSDGAAREVGIPTGARQALAAMGRFVPVRAPTEIGGVLRLTGPIPRTTEFEDTGGAFFTDRNCSQPDLLADDQAAFAETPAGTVVILGCAHAGVINTLRYVRQLTDNAPIHTVVGGMHLLNAAPERMDKTVAELQRLRIACLRPCHCTGFAAMARLWNEFPGQCQAAPVGTVLVVP